MMFIRFDYRCSNCMHHEERFVRKEVMDDQHCATCLTEGRDRVSMTRLPAGPSTHFRFYDARLKD